MKCIRLVLLGALGLSACHPQEKSSTKEFIDEANSLVSRYGLSTMPNYSDIQAQTSVFTRDNQGHELLPWTDTYWPTTYKGMAQRWGALASDQTVNLDTEADFALGAFYVSSREAAESSGLISTQLSPAEKFDIVYQVINSLDPKAAKALEDKLLPLDTELATLLDKSELTVADRVNQKRELARRYGRQIRETIGGQNLASFYPMTTEAFSNWLDKSQSPYYQFPGEYDGEGQDWSWEGVCHGWAPAAVMAAEPKHAVRVELPKNASEASRQILFTEGDLRGLLTKSWAQANNTDMFFIGRRCEQNVANPDDGIQRNSLGRGIGGAFYLYENNESKEHAFTLVQEYPRGSNGFGLKRIVLENEWQDRTPTIAYLVETSPGINYFTRDEKQAFAAAEAGSVDGLAYAQNVRFHGCWDVNPASFHTVLLENLGKANRGFVMDRTQSGQVWNQPIYKAEFTVGTLTPVADIASSDIAKTYRAPGTAFVAKVTANVYWSGEPSSPLMTYTDKQGRDIDASQIEVSVYEYTLEFDEQQRLIGGEWGQLESFETDSPDFIFGFRNAAEPRITGANNAYLRKGYQSIIKKLHDCSLRDQADGQLKLSLPMVGANPRLRTLSYVDCKL